MSPVYPGAYPGGMHRMHMHPPLPPCASPPPQPERLVMRKDKAVGNKKKTIKIFLKSIKFFQFSFNFIFSRGGGGQPKMCIPPGKILGTPLCIPSPFKTNIHPGPVLWIQTILVLIRILLFTLIRIRIQLSL